MKGVPKVQSKVPARASGSRPQERPAQLPGGGLGLLQEPMREGPHHSPKRGCSELGSPQLPGVLA